MNKMQIYLIPRVCPRTCEYASHQPARNTTLVAISQSGETGDVLRAAESYSGADVVSITNHARSSLAALAAVRYSTGVVNVVDFADFVDSGGRQARVSSMSSTLQTL